MRQFTDIPFAQDVARLTHAREAFERLLHGHPVKAEDLAEYAPIFEARYHSLATMIRRCRASQVLELASGFTLRGLAMTADPPCATSSPISRRSTARSARSSPASPAAAICPRGRITA
ncbi:MAG: hypothetical protein WDO13_01005 [Verrucomicrobiota bacterium]